MAYPVREIASDVIRLKVFENLLNSEFQTHDLYQNDQRCSVEHDNKRASWSAFYGKVLNL